MLSRTLLVATLTLTLGASLAIAQTTSVRPAYGCFKVTAGELKIHETTVVTGNTLATASKGDILIKRKRFCTLGGNWCPVTTSKGVQGFAEKKMIAVAPCPAKLSTKVN